MPAGWLQELPGLTALGLTRGGEVALAWHPATGAALATADGSCALGPEVVDPLVLVAAVELQHRPRWVLWPGTAASLVHGGVRVATAWDLGAVHQLLAGGWRNDPAAVVALAHGRPAPPPPGDAGAPDLFSTLLAPEGEGEPCSSEGDLRPSWGAGGWADTTERLAAWAELALAVARRQRQLLATLPDPAAAERTARSESVAALLCAELAADGLPLDRATAEALITASVGPRPRSEAEAAALRAERDARVLRHAPPGTSFDLRSPGQVRSLLRSVGIEVPDTRAWRLRELAEVHPLVPELLRWRKDERVGTTYGYAWLDANLGADGRLRGTWAPVDGAAGRMTASDGLHNLPAHLRAAVIAEPGHVLVRADLGQIEPRVLAAVAGDRALIAAAEEDDLYLPVARALGVDRPTAKVAVLGALYGQTTGIGAQVLPRLRGSYPVAMRYLEAADATGRAGGELRTFGGRRIPMGPADLGGMTDADERRRAAARGRYARNAVVQGAAAELFKMWAAVVRTRGRELAAQIVLCLHDELLVHVPAEAAAAAAQLVTDALAEAGHRWTPGGSVRLLADVRVLTSWAEAKD